MTGSKLAAVLVTAAVLAALDPAHALAVKVVDAAGGCDYPTIQAAVDDLPAAGFDEGP